MWWGEDGSLTEGVAEERLEAVSTENASRLWRKALEINGTVVRRNEGSREKYQLREGC